MNLKIGDARAALLDYLARYCGLRARGTQAILDDLTSIPFYCERYEGRNLSRDWLKNNVLRIRDAFDAVREKLECRPEEEIIETERLPGKESRYRLKITFTIVHNKKPT